MPTRQMSDFGMPTLIEMTALESCAALCRELGLQFIELNMNMPQYQPARLDSAELLRIAERYGIYYTIHLDENLNVSDFNPLVAEAYRATVRETIALAKVLACPILNMHLTRGVYFTLPDRNVFLLDVYREQYLSSLRTFRDECDALIGSSDIRVCVENSGGYAGAQLDALPLLLESPVFALTFDIGHSHSAGSGDEAVILSHAERLAHMHIHDALSQKNHLALGSGELDVGRYLDMAVEHNCRGVLETKTVQGLRQSVAWVRAYL